MLTRNLVLLHDRRPMMTSITPGPIRARILEWPEDDADLFTVWSVPIDDSMAQPHDITQQFALDWAAQLQFGDGIEPHDSLQAPSLRLRSDQPPSPIQQAEAAECSEEGREMSIDMLPNNAGPVQRQMAAERMQGRVG